MEVVWSRSKNPKGSQHRMRRFSPFTDTILYYSRSDSADVNLDRIRVPLTEDELAQKYPYKDEHGRYADGPILRSDSMGPRPNLMYSYKGFTLGPAGWRVKKEVTDLQLIAVVIRPTRALQSCSRPLTLIGSPLECPLARHSFRRPNASTLIHTRGASSAAAAPSRVSRSTARLAHFMEDPLRVSRVRGSWVCLRTPFPLRTTP